MLHNCVMQQKRITGIPARKPREIISCWFFSKPIIIPYKNTILSLQQYYEVCKRPSPKEQTDSSQLTQAMPTRIRKYFCGALCRITRIFPKILLITSRFLEGDYQIFSKRRGNPCLLFTGVEIIARGDEANCLWSSSCKTGWDQRVLVTSQVSSEHSAAHRAPDPTQPLRAPSQDVLQLLRFM